MLNYFKKRKAEKVLNEVFKLLSMTYSDVNHQIMLTEAQKEMFLRTDILEKHVRIKKGESNEYYITTLGLLQTLCNILINKDIYFLISDNDKLLSVEIKK